MFTFSVNDFGSPAFPPQYPTPTFNPWLYAECTQFMPIMLHTVSPTGRYTAQKRVLGRVSFSSRLYAVLDGYQAGSHFGDVTRSMCPISISVWFWLCTSLSTAIRAPLHSTHYLYKPWRVDLHLILPVLQVREFVLIFPASIRRTPFVSFYFWFSLFLEWLSRVGVFPGITFPVVFSYFPRPTLWFGSCFPPR